MKKNGSATLVFIHETGVLKVSHKSSFSLNAGICQGSHLLTIELLPFFAVECLIERDNAGRRSHIDKRISNIALILRTLTKESVGELKLICYHAKVNI